MHQFTKIFLIISVLCNFIYLSDAKGATFTASSCSCTDIQAAINAASSGDTVYVPAGTCTWTTSGCGGGTSVTINKAINLIGAGIANTIITDSTNKTTFNDTPIIIDVTASSDAAVRISGFTFQQGTGGSNAAVIAGQITGTATNRTIRIDHVQFTGILSRCLWLFTQSTGLVDNNQFDTCSNLFSANNYDTEWTTSYSLGSPNAWYLEDNTFNYTNTADIIDCQYGARIVVRYNTFTGSGSFSNSFIGNHGYDTVYRGCMFMEVYDNTMTNNTSGNLPWGIQYRGGTGVIFNNTILGVYNSPIGITNYRSCTDYVPIGYCMGGTNDGQGCYRAGDCTSGSCTQIDCDGSGRFDGNTSGQYGYPCRDQIGRGPNQTLMPLYEWNNTLNGSAVHINQYVNDWPNTTPCNNQGTYHIILGRDYYGGLQMPGYVPYTYPHPLQDSLLPPQNLRLVQ